VSLGPFDQGVFDGTEPFSAPEDCNLPGQDCGNNDARVRTNDVVQFVWSVTAAGLGNDADNETTNGIPNVVVEQILTPSANADIQILDIPVSCLPAPAGTGGSSPKSTITELDDGSIQLVCNLGQMSNGQQRSFSVAVQPLGSSTNDSFFTTTQSVTGLDDDGNVLADQFDWEENREFRISAAPAYDLIGNRVGISRGETVTRDIGRGLEPGFLFQYTAHVSADSESGARGISQLGESYSFTPGLQAFLSDGETPFDLLYAVTNCEANRFDWPRTVYGDETHNPAVSIERKVPDSGDCTITGDIENGFSLLVTGTDTSGSRFPTETIDGSSLVAGPFFVAAHSLEIFVPTAELDRTDGIPDDNRGQLVVSACLSDFDPIGDGGVSNYLDDVEPGFNGTAMADGSASNNCADRTVAQLSSDGQFSFRAVSTENDQGNETAYLPLISGFHEGDGLVEPGQSFGTLMFYNNNSNTALTSFAACTVFDATVQRLTDRGNIGATEGTFAYEGDDNAADFNPDEWQLQYGIASVSGDDPLTAIDEVSGNSIGGLDPATGRFRGSWAFSRQLGKTAQITL